MAHEIGGAASIHDLSWEELGAKLQTAADQLGTAIPDPKQWKVSINGRPFGPVKTVLLLRNGLTFLFESEGIEHAATACPDTLGRTGVLFDGRKDEGAHVAASERLHAGIGKPFMLVIEFDSLESESGKLHLRFDCPR